MPGHPDNLKKFSKLHLFEFKMGDFFNLQEYPKVTITYIQNLISKSNKKLFFFCPGITHPTNPTRIPPMRYEILAMVSGVTVISSTAQCHFYLNQRSIWQPGTYIIRVTPELWHTQYLPTYGSTVLCYFCVRTVLVDVSFHYETKEASLTLPCLLVSQYWVQQYLISLDGVQGPVGVTGICLCMCWCSVHHAP